MRVYRITKTEYIEDLSGEGAKIYGGRWNRVGDPILYFAENLSLCMLEILVHVDFANLPLDYSYIELELPEDFIKAIKSVDFIQPNWRTEQAEIQLQMYGSNWLKKQESLAMKVPSAVLPKENNILINPFHKDFQHIKVIESGKMDFDPRLLR